ncbi:MAG: hypothetical protein VKK04_25370 [Synechococcales bacterium]|nr:hypothetical protein [Synechococcales bacterium]
MGTVPSQHDLETDLEQWHLRLQRYPNDPRAYIQRGMAHFKLAHIDASITDFDQAERLRPDVTPYLWQRGLSYYYAGRFRDGARQFEIDLRVNAQDAEETLWRSLCLAQVDGQEAARRSLPPACTDPRPALRTIIYPLYAGLSSPDAALAEGNSLDPAGQFYVHLYVGLYYEAAGQPEAAIAPITHAVAQYPSDDYMWHLARVHCHLRSTSKMR